MLTSQSLPYERIDDGLLQVAVSLTAGEYLLVLQPFGWHLDSEHIPNMPEQFSRAFVIQELHMELVCDFGPYIAIVRKAAQETRPS